MNALIATQTARTIPATARKQAIEDGALIDLSENPAIKLHWTTPLACSFAVWFMMQANLKKNPALQLGELIRKISISAKITTLLKPDADEIGFEIILGADHYHLKLRIAPDETGQRAVTLMLRNED